MYANKTFCFKEFPVQVSSGLLTFDFNTALVNVISNIYSQFVFHSTKNKVTATLWLPYLYTMVFTYLLKL